jgi:hypothetical protein
MLWPAAGVCCRRRGWEHILVEERDQTSHQAGGGRVGGAMVEMYRGGWAWGHLLDERAGAEAGGGGGGAAPEGPARLQG